MPKITQFKGGGRIIFDQDDWMNGLVPNYGSSTNSNQRGTRGLASMRSMNPYRKLGYALPGYAATDVTNVSEVSEFCRNGMVNGTTAYIITNGSKLQALNLLSDTLTSSFHTISAHGGHSTVVGNDCVIYTHKVGGTSASRYLYSWSDNTDWDIGTFDFSSTFDDDFMSTAPATPLAAPYLTGGVGKPHPLIVGDDDILYIGDRNFVHAYDGQNSADNDGKFFPAVVTIPNGLIITAFVKVKYGLMIFAYLENGVGSSTFYYGKAIAYLWNYNDLDITEYFDLSSNYVSEAFEFKGTVGCFTQGRPTDPSATKSSVMQLFDGNKFTPICAFAESVPIRGGVQTVNDVIYWNAGGKVYSWGSPVLGVNTPNLNQLTEGSGSSSGLMRVFTSSNEQYVSSGATTSGGLQTFLGTDSFNANTSFSTCVAEPVFSEGKKGKVESVRIAFGQTASGGRTLTVSLSDRGNTPTTTVLSNHATVTADTMVIKRVQDSSGAPLLTFDGLKLVASYSAGSAATDAPALASVEVIYSEVSVD